LTFLKKGIGCGLLGERFCGGSMKISGKVLALAPKGYSVGGFELVNISDAVGKDLKGMVGKEVDVVGEKMPTSFSVKSVVLAKEKVAVEIPKVDEVKGKKK
jgi:hypothetical protein